MSVRDRHIDREAKSVLRTIPFTLDEVGNNLSAALRGSFKPGHPFEIVDIQAFCRDVTANFSLDVRIGNTSVLADRTAAAAVPGGSNVGNGTVGSLTADAHAKIGTWTLRCIEEAENGGTFELRDPSNRLVARDIKVGVAYNGRFGLNFTISDGATDFEVGDTFTIAVSGALAVPADATLLEIGVARDKSLRRGGATDAINVHVTTNASGAAEEVQVFVTIRPTGLRGD